MTLKLVITKKQISMLRKWFFWSIWGDEFFRPNYRFPRNFGFVSNESELRFSKSGFGLTKAEIGFKNSLKNEFLTNFQCHQIDVRFLLKIEIWKLKLKFEIWNWILKLKSNIEIEINKLGLSWAKLSHSWGWD